MVPAHKQRVYASKYKLPEDERDDTPGGRCGWCNVPKMASVESHWHGSYCEGCYSSCVAPYRTGSGPASLATDEPESSTPEDFECLLPTGVCDDWPCSQLDDDSGGDEPDQGGGVLLLSPAGAEERCSFVFFSSAARSHRKELLMATARSNAARLAPALKKPKGFGLGLLVRAL
jgi:hypothetical protein